MNHLNQVYDKHCHLFESEEMDTREGDYNNNDFPVKDADSFIFTFLIHFLRYQSIFSLFHSYSLKCNFQCIDLFVMHVSNTILFGFDFNRDLIYKIPKSLLFL